jgi:hypothetical protein
MLGLDAFTRDHAPHLDNAYVVVHRIVRNGYCGMGRGSGGFRQWRQELHGACDNLDDTNLPRGKVPRPLLRCRGRCKSGPKPRATARVDHLYQNVQREMQQVLKVLKFEE